MQPRYSVSVGQNTITMDDGAQSHSRMGLNIESLYVPYGSDDALNRDELRPKPFRFWKVSTSCLRGTAYRNNPSSGYRKQEGSFTSVLDSDSPIFDTGETWWQEKAYEVAVADLNGKLRPVDISVDIFQFRMSLSTAKRLLNLVETMKQSLQKMKGRNATAKEISNLYLEWTYGIEPTLNTLLDLNKHLHKKGMSGLSLAHFRGRGSFKTTETVNANTSLFNYTTVLIPMSKEASYRCQVDLYLKPDLNKWQQLLQITSMNPLAWLYEMTAYSFVLDWVWNLGAYMRGLETALAYDSVFHSGCVTYSSKQDTNVNGGTYKSVNSEPTIENVAGSHHYRLYDRKLLGSYPVPTLPKFRVDLGARRVLNAAALLSQLLPDADRRIRGGDRKLLRPLGRGSH